MKICFNEMLNMPLQIYTEWIYIMQASILDTTWTCTCRIPLKTDVLVMRLYLQFTDFNRNIDLNCHNLRTSYGLWLLI